MTPAGILSVNGGSSSLKCQFFELGQDDPAAILHFSDLLQQPRLATWYNDVWTKDAVTLESDIDPFEACLRMTLDFLVRKSWNVAAIGHRVVHGGSDYRSAVPIDENVLSDLKNLIPLAPLHQPTSVKLIEICQRLLPDTSEVACFDTMFHSTLPKHSRHFALPQEYTNQGLVRYGFHGLSYESVMRQLVEFAPQAASEKIVIAHLGAGASLCGVADGLSMSTTMGFSALDGLPMGTRSGRIDPGVLLHLMRGGKSVADIEDLLYRRSGLLGISGVSSDMQALQRSGQSSAQEAIDFFNFRVAHEIGGIAADLGGVDRLVFTGGIGENDADVRLQIAKRCGWLGLSLDVEANNRGDRDIHLPSSRLLVHVVPAREEWVIAQETAKVLQL